MLGLFCVSIQKKKKKTQILDTISIDGTGEIICSHLVRHAKAQVVFCIIQMYSCSAYNCYVYTCTGILVYMNGSCVPV